MAQVVDSSVVLDLPVDLLAAVLQHVQQPARLRCCALVSQKWRQAANMTTNTVVVTADTQQRFDSLSAWFNSNPCASRIQSIQAVYKFTAHSGGTARPVLRVPFPALKQLRSLQLQQCRMQIVSPAVDATNSLAATVAAMAALSTAPTVSGLMYLAALTRLKLVDTSLDLSELSSCTGLQHLRLCNVDLVAAEAATSVGAKSLQDDSQQAGKNVLSLLASALPQLCQLTHLDFKHTAGSEQNSKQKQWVANFLASLRNTQELKELQLNMVPFQATDLAHIPTSLSSLHLHDSPAWCSSVIPQLQQMTRLQCLRLTRPKLVYPAVLSSLTLLTLLGLKDCFLDNPQSVTDLLRAVQQLKQLRHLDLTGCLAYESFHDDLYAALTAGSQLTSLNITDCDIPRVAYQHIFPDGYSTTSLVSITTCPDLLHSVSSWNRMVACCPALQELVIEDDYCSEPQSSTGLSALQGLSALTTLIISNVDLSDHELRAVAACSQLIELKIRIPIDARHSVTPADLMRLTQLTRLSWLSLHLDSWYDYDWLNVNLVAAGGAPDVYMQLQQAIAEYERRFGSGSKKYCNAG